MTEDFTYLFTDGGEEISLSPEDRKEAGVNRLGPKYELRVQLLGDFVDLVAKDGWYL